MESEKKPESIEVVKLKRSQSPNKILERRKSTTRKKGGDLTVTEFIAGMTVKKNMESRQFEDPFADYYNNQTGLGMEFLPIEPIHNPNIVRRIPLENNVLLQCIEAMVQNIEGTDHQVEYIGPDEDKEYKKRPEVQAEYERITALISAPNEEYDMSELRRRIRRDRETFGYAFYEVVRDTAQFIKAIYHIPAHSVRLTRHDQDPVMMSYDVRRNNKLVKIERNKLFRRYIQKDYLYSKMVYFKEFGDPRIIDYTTGKVDPSTPLALQATEILMVSEYRSGYLYGQPRWINQIPSILGSRESELLNLSYFKDNAMPAMVVMVAGGYLSQDSVDGIDNKFNRNRGRDKQNEVLVLEAYGDEQGTSTDGQMPIPKVEMKPLTDDRQTDILFQEYDKECQRKIRSAFRLPPIILGGSDEYTYATADASMVMVESQVFQPERNETDEFINKYFLGDGTNPPKYWRFRSNPTRLVDDKQVAQSLTVLNQIGAMTPNDAINVANQLFNLKIKPIVHVWGDYPHAMVLKLIEKGVPLQGMEDLINAGEQLRMEKVQMDLATAKKPDPSTTSSTTKTKAKPKANAKKEALDSTIEMLQKLTDASNKTQDTTDAVE